MFRGLRGRLVAALLLTSTVTLAVAAFLLLSPLESRLRRDEIEGISAQLRADRPLLTKLATRDLQPRSPALRRMTKTLKISADAEIVILASGGGVLAATDLDRGETFPEAQAALRDHRTVRRVLVAGSVTVAHVAIPVTVHRTRVAVVAVRRLDDASAAVAVVRRAFLGAAAISLVIALALGLLLASRLAQRLRALRDTALRVAELGPVVEMGADASRDEVGDLTRALVTMQDRLRRQEQARLSFVATASHELRTPLSSLRVMLDLLRDDLDRALPDLDDARQQVARADQQAERLAGLAGDLLDLSRLDAGIPIRSERVDLAELVRAVVAEFELRARETGHELVLDGPASAWARADPGAVAQIVRILLDNAVRHGPRDAAIVLSVGRDDADRGCAWVAVGDAGPPIAASEHARIFERFERGPATGDAPGFGLGLAIGRELAGRMDGELELEDGDHASFRLTLPLAPIADD
ncbi:MAG TPA: HAMP domain-containing sensor histidine kinase [Solirubrobacteraceae bacterium]|jgi:signal transduction histidine kinase